MEEEEIKSYASPGGEPHSPPSRITVTVATPAPPSTAITKYTSPVTLLHQSNLTLALPIQHTTRPIGSSGGGGGGREDCWSEDATSVLIDAWGERYMELSRGNLKQKHWKEVADIVSSREDYTKTPKTDIQCKNRIDTVKKKYKIEKAKVTSGCGPSRWPFFERLDCLLSPPSTAASTAKVASPATASVASVGINSHKMVPMGIPMGVRPLPLPGLPNYSPHHHFQIPPHFQPQLQPPPPPPPSLQLQQQFRQNNFPSLPPMFNKFNNSVNNPNSTSNNNKPQIKRGLPSPPSVDSESDQEGWSLDSADSLPPLERKRPRVELNSLGGKVNEGKGKEKAKKEKEREVWGNSVRELTRAILKFGEAYEAAESAKLQQIVEMEKQRMKFAKEMELQRMKFFMKTQLELSQLNDNGSNNSDARAGGSSGRAGGVRIGGGGGESNHHNHHDNHLSHAVSDASD